MDCRKSLLLTSVDVDNNANISRRRSSTKALMNLSKQPGPNNILVVEEWEPLPALVDLPHIQRTVLKHAPFSSSEKENAFWHSQIASKEFQDLLSDAFYLILGHIVQRHSSLRAPHGILSLDKSTHFSRMADNYVQLIKRLDIAKVPTFFAYFEFILAFAIVLCFKTSFPLQPDSFRSSSFVYRVLDLCTEWVRGFNPSEPKCPHSQRRGQWILQCLRENADQSPDLSLLLEALVGNGTDGGGGEGDPSHQSKHRHSSVYHYRRGSSNKAAGGWMKAIPIRRVAYKLQHSPLMKCHLMNHQGKENPHLASRMRWSEEPCHPIKTMAVNHKDRKMLRSRNGRHPRLRAIPNVVQEVKKVANFRLDVSKQMEDEREECRRQVHLIRQRKVELPHIEPLSKEVEAMVQANDVHALSDYIITHKTRPATLGVSLNRSIESDGSKNKEGGRCRGDDLVPV